MGVLKKPQKVKLIVAMIANKKELFQKVEMKLEKKYGPIDYHSKVIKFDYTDYYQKEMGKDLLRKFISFENLIFPAHLIKIKRYTMALEQRFSTSGKRNINIDPGYLNLGKLILASTKDNLQRIYLAHGIFAEVTLYYKKGGYHPFFYTYPDYQTEEYLEVFEEIRNIFYNQLNSGLKDAS